MMRMYNFVAIGNIKEKMLLSQLFMENGNELVEKSTDFFYVNIDLCGFQQNVNIFNFLVVSMA